MQHKVVVGVAVAWIVPPLLIAMAYLAGGGSGNMLSPLTVAPGVLLWFACGLMSLVRCVLDAKRRRWRLAALHGLLPAALALTVSSFADAKGVDGLELLPRLAQAGDRLVFLTRKPGYDRRIAALPHPRLKTFDWGGWPSMWSGVVYDETDRMLLSRERRSLWVARDRESELKYVDDAIPLGSHYYLCYFSD